MGSTITCDTCGNDFAEEQPVCPFCGARRLFAGRAPPRKNPARTAVLKAGMPTVEQALTELRAQLALARAGKSRVVKLIHGYGSTGSGGKIREAVRRALAKERSSGRIKDWIPGEDVAIRADELRGILDELPALRRDPDYRRPNEGVTIVVVRF